MKKELNELFAIPQVKWPLIGIAGLVIALLIFHAGVAVGEHRANSGFFIARGGAAFPFLPHSYMEGGHGVVGTISKLALPTTTITTRDGASEQVAITKETQIRDGAETLSPANLAVGEEVIVVGEPQDGDEGTAVDALLVRVLSTTTPQTTNGIVIIHMPMMR